MSDIKTTRAIKAGLYIKDKKFQKSLVDSHDFFNFCVKYYTELLLEMRGEDVYMRDPQTGKEELKTSSYFQEKLCKRMKDAAKRNGNSNELTPDDVENFSNWCKQYYEETVASANPKGKLNTLQKSEIKVETTGGRPSRLICQTRLLINENPNILNEVNAPDEIKDFAKKIHEKSSAEKVAEWICGNQAICIEHCIIRKDRINEIVEEYPKEQKKKKERCLKKEGDVSSFGSNGIRTLPIILKPAVQYTNDKSNDDIRNISSWYYGAWTIAVQRLKSWNTWNDTAKENYSNTKAQVAEKEIKLEQLSDEAKEFIKYVLEEYEKKKDAEIRQNADYEEIPVKYRLLGRELRGLDDVLEKLVKEETYKDRNDVLNKLQDESKSEIGDINLFRFIAADSQFKYVKDIKKCAEAAMFYKQVNKVKSKLDHIKDHAAFTMCDSNHSPAWTQFEIGGGSGSNCPGYSYNIEKGIVCMSLISIEDDKLSVCTNNEFGIGISNQIKCLSIEKGNIIYKDVGTGRIFKDVKIGGAKLQFNRDLNARNKNWRSQNKLDAYFNISIEISEKTEGLPDELVQMTSEREALGLYFSGEEKKKIFKSSGKIIKDALLKEYVSNRPYRVMAVDLGLRATFSYSIMSINAEEKNKKACFKMRDFLTEESLFVNHERSGQIRLVGDKPTRLVEEKRKELEDSANLIRYKIDAIRYFRRLSNSKQTEREKNIKDLLDRYSQSTRGWPFDASTYSYETLLDLSNKFINLPNDKWTEFIDATALAMKKELSKDFKKWSDEVRKPRNFNDVENCQIIGLAGKSLWNISYLTKVLNIMKKWHTLAEKSHRRSGLDKGEVFARELRDKIDNLKELRQKETSDALVMTALGYVWVAGQSKNRLVKVVKDNMCYYVSEQDYLENRDKYTLYASGKDKYKAKDGFWIKLYESCDVIVFEELQHYRTDDERPTRENALLMNWAHRSTADQVRMQGELFGLKIGAVGASYSSRFHAISGCPGVRGNVYDVKKLFDAESELKSYFMQQESKRRISTLSHLSRILLSMYGDNASEVVGKYLNKIQMEKEMSNYGILIPDNGGEYFISGKYNEAGKVCLTYINADINAAQNLARRWITRYDNPQKLNVSICEGALLPISSSSVRINRVIGPSCINVSEPVTDKFFEGNLVPNLRKNKPIENEIDNFEDEEEVEKYSVFRDLSGVFFPLNKWGSSLKFWRKVREDIYKLAFEQPIVVRI